MNRKVLCTALTATTIISLLAGCGGGSTGSSAGGTSAGSSNAASSVTSGTSSAASSSTGTSSAAASSTTSVSGADEGKVLNIQCWNTEFQSRITDHYPGYEKVDDTTGKIGDVTVKWHITPTDDNAYQNNLDSILPDNESASADDKTDIFLMEADYALKYVNSDVTMNVKDLGITDDDLKDMFQYTKDIATDSSGNLKGLSWQACSAGLIYNRDAAKEVLGSDDPDTVQEAVKDWDTFNATAAKLKDAGYKITSTVNDTYRVYSNNVSAPWVQDGKVVVDANIKKWVDDSKTLSDAGETGTYALWSDDWSKGFYPDGKVFCYFGPAWLINFSMKADDPESLAAQGKWGFCVGPQSFYWGGTWIAAATGTDNPSLVKDIMLKMTTDESILTDIAKKDSDCVNNKTVLGTLAADSSFGLSVLGGQNPYAVLEQGAENL